MAWALSLRLWVAGFRRFLFEVICVLLSKLGNLGFDDSAAVVRVHLEHIPSACGLEFAIVVLMIPQGGVEGLEGFDGGDDWVSPDFGVGDFLHDFLGPISFFFVRYENDRAVLGAVIGPLLVERRGVVDGKKDVEQVFGLDDGRVVSDFDHFCMPRGAREHLFIGGIGNVAAGEATDDIFDSQKFFIDSFSTPEAAAAENHCRELGGLNGGCGCLCLCIRRRFGVVRHVRAPEANQDECKREDCHAEFSFECCGSE